MQPQWIIEKKRDGFNLYDKEIEFFIAGYADGSIPDYQMSALAMAIYFKGMRFEEIACLTKAMINSGEIIDTSILKNPTADKHSTGGIGDKVSLILAPMIACCGVAVPMLSGRGLGITGGTLDKLESIQGYKTDLNNDRFIEILKECNCCLIGQTASLAPADKKLYALRDVTATVPSMPLIVASIMSKKIAEGIDALVLDVKSGSGAFMKTVDDSRDLATNLVRVGRLLGKKVSAIITDMNQPLGRTVGNALEVRESVEALQGDGPEDLMEVTFELCSEMLLLTDVYQSKEQAKEALAKTIRSGAAFNKFKDLVALQGGDISVLEDLSKLPEAKMKEDIVASSSGYITRVDAELFGRAGILLGAGRQKVEDVVDPAVGFSNIVKIGEEVEKGDVLFSLHSNDQTKSEQALDMLNVAIVIDSKQSLVRPVIIERVQV